MWKKTTPHLIAFPFLIFKEFPFKEFCCCFIDDFYDFILFGFFPLKFKRTHTHTPNWIHNANWSKYFSVTLLFFYILFFPFAQWWKIKTKTRCYTRNKMLSMYRWTNASYGQSNATIVQPIHRKWWIHHRLSVFNDVLEKGVLVYATRWDENWNGQPQLCRSKVHRTGKHNLTIVWFMRTFVFFSLVLIFYEQFCLLESICLMFLTYFMLSTFLTSGT